MQEDYHAFPRLSDSLSYLYIEHAVIDRDQSALRVLQETGRTHVPIANLCVLLLGPGTSISHAAVSLLASSGVSMVWAGEDGTHYYAHGMGETHRAKRLLYQAELATQPEKRQKVVLRMYEMRFGHVLEPDLTIEQIRGMEGVRVRTAYADASRKYNVEWKGRAYDRSNWAAADPVNRALSAANAVLHGISHAAIVSGGYSPGLGFLHSGWHLAFVYDVADFYKTQLTVPLAFEVAAESEAHVETRARMLCRERIRESKLLEHILPDIEKVLDYHGTSEAEPADELFAQPWWQPDAIAISEVHNGHHGTE
jgi:CRISPR-associated protein Cas1